MDREPETDRRKDFIKSLVALRSVPLESTQLRYLIPTVKLGENKTYSPWEYVSAPAIMIKVGDLLTGKSANLKPIFNKISDAGGIHKFLGFKGNVILSQIMEDHRLDKFSNNQYIKVINALRPNYYLTPDAPTYNNTTDLSSAKLKKIKEDAEALFKNCTKSKPIGLVKGCNANQIESHTDWLLDQKISFFVFHISPFLAKKPETELLKAKDFVKRIRKKVPKLLVYSLGLRNLKNFYRADGFVTQSHFIYKMDSKPKIMERLKRIDDQLIEIQLRPSLASWGIRG